MPCCLYRQQTHGYATSNTLLEFIVTMIDDADKYLRKMKKKLFASIVNYDKTLNEVLKP